MDQDWWMYKHFYHLLSLSLSFSSVLNYSFSCVYIGHSLSLSLSWSIALVYSKSSKPHLHWYWERNLNLLSSFLRSVLPKQKYASVALLSEAKNFLNDPRVCVCVCVWSGVMLVWNSVFLLSHWLPYQG